MSKLDLFRTFIRVTELASFTQASAQLGLPRSTVSEHVRQLEELVGTRLLQRTTRRVQATQDGLALYERCRDLLDDVDEVEGLFRDDQALSGRLRIDLPIAIARKLVMPRLGEFLDRHPQLEVEVSSSDRRVDLVREGFDCVLRVGAIGDDALIARRLGSLPLVNCASPAYLQRYGTPHTLADLDAHRLVHYVPTLGTRCSGFEYEQDGKTHFRPMPGRVTVNNSDSYKSACLGGFGLIQVPLAGVRQELADGTLCAVLEDFLPAPMVVSLLYAQRRNLPRRVRAVMDWLSDLLEREMGLSHSREKA
ncbi:LysR family transcriptional regulator [Pseudomonas sp. LRF_L74]|uniref:LysR family transcriptional regulator n=1 Tax=Pseudomonas sp. LRF_L74 TaxID=3369422 RepID=UPI003F634CC7